MKRIFPGKRKLPEPHARREKKPSEKNHADHVRYTRRFRLRIVREGRAAQARERRAEEREERWRKDSEEFRRECERRHQDLMFQIRMIFERIERIKGREGVAA